jgi:hypothetical protein
MCSKVRREILRVIGITSRGVCERVNRLLLDETVSSGSASADTAYSALSGLYPLNKYQIPERGARMARREAREFREYLRAEQRSQPGCPARKLLVVPRMQATSRPV